MPGLYKDEGVVLRTIKLGEADRIVTLYCRHNGKLRAVAKGIRKTKSRFGGRLEPFSHVRLMIYRGRGELDTITAVDVVEPHRTLREDYPRLVAGAALLELIDKVTPDREGAHQMYALLLAGLAAVERSDAPSVVPAFAIKLLSLAGYHPHLRRCALCGDGDLGGFSPAAGGVLCPGCCGSDPGAVALDEDRIDLLSRLLSSDFGIAAAAAEVADVTALLQRYAEYHLERPLRSLRLLRAGGIA